MDLMQSLIASKLLGGGGGSEPVLKTKNIYENGDYAASADDADGYSQVSVNVAPRVASKTLQVNGIFNSGVFGQDGFNNVTVDVQNPIKTSTLSVTSNGTYLPGPSSYIDVTVPTIPDNTETEVDVDALLTNFDDLRISFTNKTTGGTGYVNICPSEIEPIRIPMTSLAKTLVVGPDSDHYILLTRAERSIYVTQKGYTITGIRLSTSAGLFSEVNVEVSPNVGTKSITDNGTYNASSDSLDGYSQVVVNVAGSGEPDELSSTEPKLKLFSEGGSTYVINSDGSMDLTWLGYNAIGNCFCGLVPLKNAKKIIIEIGEYGESYQHGMHVDTRNFNTAIGVTDIPVNNYIDLDNLQTNNHIVTDVEFNGNTYYGETNISREIDLTPYIGQDLYLFLQLPGVTLTGLKVTVLYDKFGVYEYHWSDDGKICVRKGIGITEWFFIGLTKGDTDLDLEATYPELFKYIPKNGDITFSYAYETASSDTVIGYIGLYHYTDTWYIRSWDSTLAHTMGGTFYSNMDVNAGPHQHTENSNPLDVEIYDETLLDKTIISNGTYRAEDEGYIGYGEITVAAPVPKADIGYNKIFKDGLTDIYFDANNGKINSYWDKSNPTGATIGNSIQGRTDLNGTVSALHITGNITDSWAHYNSSTLERCQFVVGFTDRLWNEAILVGYNDNGSVYIKEEVELTNVQSTSVDIFINLKDAQYQQYASTPKYLFISLFGIEGEFKVDLIPDVAEIHVPYSNICTCYHMGDIPAAVGKNSMISEWKTGANIGCSWNGTVDLVAAGYSKMHYKAYIGAESYDDKVNQDIRPVIIGVSPNTYNSVQYVNQSTVSNYYSVYDVYLTSQYKDVYVEGVIDFSNETDPQYLLVVATGHCFEMLDMWFE